MSIKQEQGLRRLAVISIVTGVLLPPIGVIAGFLVRAKVPLDAEGNKPDTRRLGNTGVVVGLVMSTVMIFALVLGLGYKESLDQQAEVTAQQERAQQDFDDAVKDSPSYGKVYTGFCQELDVVRKASYQDSGMVVDASQINDDLLEGYTSMGTTKSPNRDLYGEYAAHLKTFDEHDQDAQVEIAERVHTALGEDYLACTKVTGK